MALLGAHFFGDVLSNSSKLAELKRRGSSLSRVKATALHCGIHAVWVFLFTWPWGMQIMLMAGIYIGTTHFAIDLSRIFIEQNVIPEKEFIVLKRKEVLRWFLGKGNEHVNSFMNSHFKRWFLINFFDQTSHMVVAIIFVFYVT